MMNNIELNLLLLESPHAWRRHNTQVNMVSAVIYPPYTKIEKLEETGSACALCAAPRPLCVSQWPLDPLLFERGFSKKEIRSTMTLEKKNNSLIISISATSSFYGLTTIS